MGVGDRRELQILIEIFEWVSASLLSFYPLFSSRSSAVLVLRD